LDLANCNINGEYDGKYGIDYWPPVVPGAYSSSFICYGSDNIYWRCLENGKFDEGGPDFYECWIDVFKDEDLSGIGDVIDWIEDVIYLTKAYNPSITFEGMYKIMNILNKLQYYVEYEILESDLYLTSTLVNNFMNSFSNVIALNNAWITAPEDKRTEIVSKILLSTHNSAFFMNKSNETYGSTFRLEYQNIISEINIINNFHKLEFSANSSSIELSEYVNFERVSNTLYVALLINHLNGYLPNGINGSQLINTNIISFNILSFNETDNVIDGLKVTIR
jgi:hypothetical protein